MTNIKLDLQEKDKESLLHPQAYINSLGIKWKTATPCPMAEAWWFCGCTNLPDPLPPSITVDQRPSEIIHLLDTTFSNPRQ